MIGMKMKQMKLGRTKNGVWGVRPIREIDSIINSVLYKV